MPTQAVKERKVKRRTHGSWSGPEKSLRRGLAYQKKIKDEYDDEGLYNWLRRLHVGTKGADHRSQWEKDLEERLKKELGL